MANNSRGNIQYSIKDFVGLGELSISDEVLVVIAALATTEVEGVAALAGNITNAVAARLGAGKLSKGVKIHINNRVITADVSINIKDGYAIPDVSAQVQDRVKQAIETIQKQNGYSFAFATNDLNTKKIVTVLAKDLPIEKVVEQVLAGQDVSYTIQGKDNIFKIVFGYDFHKAPEDCDLIICNYLDTAKNVNDEIIEFSEDDKNYIVVKVNNIVSKIDDIDEKIEALSNKWKIERIAKAELAILRLAVYEILYDADIPDGVAMNEALELAHKYGDESASSFINGILSNVLKEKTADN